jgi:SAM-dependent methyltransferase
VLDLGCGVGRHALLLAEHGFDVEAIDGSLAGLDERITQANDLIQDCTRLIASLRGSGPPEERIQNKVENMLTILVILTEYGLRALQRVARIKYTMMIDNALRGRASEVIAHADAP